MSRTAQRLAQYQGYQRVPLCPHVQSIVNQLVEGVCNVHRAVHNSHAAC